jgi:hypothetical protein
LDPLTFVAALVSALAWPVTILIIFIVLRRPLLELVPLLTRFRYGNIELDFGQRVREIASEIQKVLPPTNGTGPIGVGLSEYNIRLAQLSPRAVILEAWLQLEEAAVVAAKKHGLNLTSQETRSPLLLGQALEQAGILDEAKQKIFYRLRNLRNAATHASDFDFEPESALEYADSALRLADFIRSA